MENGKRLIDANALVKIAEKRCGVVNIKHIDYCTTVDAAEVVHAYWTGSRFNPMTGEYEEYCSHCCAWSSEYDKPYCPNCGAKMDG